MRSTGDPCMRVDRIQKNRSQVVVIHICKDIGKQVRSLDESSILDNITRLRVNGVPSQLFKPAPIVHLIKIPCSAYSNV